MLRYSTEIAVYLGNCTRFTFTFSALNYCGGFFFSNLSAIHTKWCAQTFPPIFGLFAIFDRNFANIVATSSDYYVVRLKRLSILKKIKNCIKIDQLTATQYMFELCTSRTNSALWTGAWQKQTISALPAGARNTISPKLWTVIDDVEIIIKVVVDFSINA